MYLIMTHHGVGVSWYLQAILQRNIRCINGSATIAFAHRQTDA